MSILTSFRDKDIYFHHSLSQETTPSDYPMHTHDFLEIDYIVSGKVQFLVEGNLYDMHAGELLITRDSESHKLIIPQDTVYDRFVLHFSPSLIQGIDPEGVLLQPFYDRELGRKNRVFAGEMTPYPIEAMLHSLCDDVPHSQKRILVLSFLFCILPQLQRTFLNRKKADIIQQNTGASLVQYVNAHLFEQLTVEKISKKFYISLSQCERLFHAATGSSIYRYILIKRLFAAQQKIRSGASTRVACQQSGFVDYSAFYKAYCRQFGHSPAKDKPSSSNNL